MRKFEKQDWYGFSGAEEDEDHPAMIGETMGAIIVVDLNGMEVIYNDVNDDDIVWMLQVPYATAVAIAEMLEKEEPSPDLLLKWGFREV